MSIRDGDRQLHTFQVATVAALWLLGGRRSNNFEAPALIPDFNPVSPAGL
jgi:hypothetical protein